MTFALGADFRGASDIQMSPQAEKQKLQLLEMGRDSARECTGGRDFEFTTRGVKLIFTGGHISLRVAFKGPKF